ncbi:MAG: hypothetical protein QME12_04210 [Nanoarchaeota archaeon]|nr:hypothetical protein [Nanoarchaeota archaeon]
MNRGARLALLIAASFASSGSLRYEPIITNNEIDRITYGLPEGVEVETIPTRLGFCGKTATVVMDEYGYQIWCGGYTFKHPTLGRDGCFGNTLERRIMLTDIVDKWTDVNCDGFIELYQSGRNGTSVSYLDISTVQMIEGMGMRVEGQLAENAERFIEAANMYALLLIDMNKPKAEKLFEIHKARHLQGGQE